MPTSPHFRTDNDTSSDANLTTTSLKCKTFGQKLMTAADELSSRGQHAPSPADADCRADTLLRAWADGLEYQADPSNPRHRCLAGVVQARINAADRSKSYC